MDKEHSDQVSSGDQTSIDWDTDYIVQHAKLMGQIREKISAKAMAIITIAQTKDKLYYDQRHADSKVTLLNRYICIIIFFDFLETCSRFTFASEKQC